MPWAGFEPTIFRIVSSNFSNLPRHITIPSYSDGLRWSFDHNLNFELLYVFVAQLGTNWKAAGLNPAHGI